MYYKDLSFYLYIDQKPIKSIVNMGWLSATKSFNKGTLDIEYIEKLKKIIVGNDSFEASCNTVRSIYRCKFCKNKEVNFEHNNKVEYVGMDEILIPSENKKYYFSAPSMIIHYIEEHNYLPDESFLKAILAIDLNMEYSGDAIFKHLLEKSRS